MRYKRLLEEINSGKYKPNEVMKIAESLGISGNPGEELPEYMLAGRGGRYGVDSSIEGD